MRTGLTVILFQTWNTASAVFKAMEAIIMLRAVISSDFGIILDYIKSSGAIVSMGSAA